MTIRVLVADDQWMVRDGFRMLLKNADGIEIVAEAENGLEAVEKATRRILAADELVRVLILTTFDLDEYIYEALRAGASGFLLKDVPTAELVHAVRVIAAGDALLSPAVTRRLLDRVGRRLPASATTAPSALAELTEREREVFELLARGLSNAEIAEVLTVGDATVKTHVSNVLMKLNLRDRVQAVVLAYESGLIAPGTSP